MTKTRNRLISVGIALLVLIAAALLIIPQETASAAAAWDGTTITPFGGTDGTSPGTAYEISSGEQLAYLADMVNKGTAYSGVYFKLTDDIDLGGKEWTPIGYSSYDRNNNRSNPAIIFSGNFDGNGHTISNLTITNLNKHLGLFGFSNGTISNIILDNVNIISTHGIGAICNNNSGTITGCGVKSGTLTLSGDNGGNIGGICENNSGTISKCFNAANISKGTGNAGIAASNTSSGTIDNCYNTGKVEAGSQYESGICSSSYGAIQYCLNLGKVSSKGTANGICSTGTGTIDHCYNDSNVCSAALSGYGFKVTNSGDKTSAELCGDLTALGFDENVWTKGSVGNRVVDADNSRLATITYKYPALSGIGTPTRTVEFYNFSTTSTEDWQEFTPITTADEFLAINDDLAAGEYKNYVLKNDINFNGKEIKPIIGESLNSDHFKFSGNGHTIRNFKINKPDDQYVGLFAINSNGSLIMNLAVENGEIIGGVHVGGICGYLSDNSTIYGCSFDGKVTGTSSSGTAGGICGSLLGGELTNCFNSADVTGQNYAGGVAGRNGSGYIQYCISAGTVSGATGRVGGVLGYKSSSGTITRCYYDSDVCKVENEYSIGNMNLVDSSKLYVNRSNTGALCVNSLILDAFNANGEVWQMGSYADEATNGRLGTRKAKYINLIGIGTPKSLKTDIYNFSINSTPDWETYEPIASVEDFKNIENNLSGNYVLTQNIDFESKGSSPIAYKSGTSFKGKLSGDGHTISNIEVAKTYDTIGLFGTNDGLIMNLAVSGKVEGEDYIGGICGKNNGTIYCCSFDGEATVDPTSIHNNMIGGICGSNSGVISNCYSSADVSSYNRQDHTKYVGGICGELTGKDPVLEYCISVGKVSGYGDKLVVGGICGYAGRVSYGGTSAITYCWFDRDVNSHLGNLFNSGNTITTKNNNQSYSSEYLCGNNIGGFDSDIWSAGKGIDVVPNEKDNKFGTRTRHYMSLKCFGESDGIVDDVFNFAYDGGNDDWQTYTLISSDKDFSFYWQWDVKWSENYVLGDDITLTYSLEPNSQLGIPSLSAGTFTGKFSGNGHTISNVTVNLSDTDYIGLFGTNQGLIMDLSVKGDITGKDYTGGICGMNQGTIYRCSFEGNVNGQNNVGGICGYNGSDGTANGKIKNCYVVGDAAGNSSVSGICGKNNASGDTVENCYFAGKVTSNVNGSYSPIAKGGTIKNCYFNRELCAASNVSGSMTGLTTEMMTNDSALASYTMNGFSSFLTKKENDKGENGAGTAYYPSFSKDNAPSVGYTAELTLTKASPETPVLGDDIVFDCSMTFTFDNGGSTNYISLGNFSIKIGDDVVVESNDFTADVNNQTFSAQCKTTQAGKVTYTLVYNNPNCAYIDGEFTKDLVVDVEKLTLTADKFTFTAPTDLEFNNTAKSATVTANSDTDGIGDIIAVKYYDVNGKECEPINAGKYTVKIDVAMSKNYKAAADLTSDGWKFTIEKAPALTLPDINVSYSWVTNGEITIPVTGLPENMGQTAEKAWEILGPVNVTCVNRGCYSDGKFTFILGPNTADEIGKTGSLTITLAADNYVSVKFTVVVTLNDKNNQEAPDSTAFDVVFTNDGSALTAEIKTELNGVEYSFDGKTWSGVNTKTVAHLEDVTAYIRYAETDGKNASPAVSKTVKSGHGTLVHHEAIVATCQHDGNTEYWECEVCAKYYSDEAAATEIALADTVIAKTDHKWSVKFESNKDGHWHKCEYCDAVTDTESHISSGAATTTTAEYCTECGYEISPKKNSGSSGNGGGHYSGGSGYRDTTNTDTNPTINGTEKSWADIAADLSKMTGGTVTITLNGETTVPADVIKAIADNKITVEFVSDSSKSWIIDGAKITAVSAVDLSILPGSVDTGSLRGVTGVKFKLNANIPADLKVAFKNQYAGEFANIYRLVDNKLVFQNCVKVAEDGSAVLSDMTAGEYAVMLGKYSDRLGDVNNDGVLNVGDALSLLRYSIGLEKGENLQMGDFNGDGKIDLADALAVLRWSVGLTA